MTQNLDNILVFGENVKPKPIEKSLLKGIFAGAFTAYDFYKAEFQGFDFVLLKRKSAKSAPPSHMLYFAKRIGEKLKRPVVFLLDALKTIERDRLVQKGIYFIVSGKYAFLPFLMVNRLSSSAAATTRLSPMGQYILLYHLQMGSIQNLTAGDLAAFMPYSYVSITRGLRQLADCGLVSLKLSGKSKRIVVSEGRMGLWNKSLPFLKSPVKKVRFIDNAIDGDHSICGINALASYTRLNPDPQKMYALTEAEFSRLKGMPVFDVEGDTRLEVWAYPPIPLSHNAVDPLSLYLSLQSDPDPRVQKELEYLLKEIWLKD